MGMTPGVDLDNGTFIWESVLVFRPGDFYIPSELDPRAGSVSFHYWPGEAALREVSARCDAPYGSYLVLPEAQIGDAKVWMAQSGDDNWQVVHDYPLDRCEPAEWQHSLGSTK